MLVRMKNTMAGPEGIYDAGALANFPPAKARMLIDAGYATLHESEELAALPTIAARVEAAAIDHGAETATMPAARKRRGG